MGTTYGIHCEAHKESKELNKGDPAIFVRLARLSRELATVFDRHAWFAKLPDSTELRELFFSYGSPLGYWLLEHARCRELVIIDCYGVRYPVDEPARPSGLIARPSG